MNHHQHTPYDAARNELAAEQWRALVNAEKRRILQRKSAWHFIKSWLRGRVIVTLTWRNP